jgi:hypothetical protein
MMSENSNTILAFVSGSVVGGHEMQFAEILLTLRKQHDKILVVCSNDTTLQFFTTAGFVASLIDFSVEGKVWRQWLSSRDIASRIAHLVEDHQTVLVSGGTLEACICLGNAVRRLSSHKRLIAYVPMYIDRSITHGLIGTFYNCLVDHLARIYDSFLTINRVQAKLLSSRIKRPVAFVRNRIRAVSSPTISKGRRLVFVGRFDDKQKNIVELIEFSDSVENPFRELILIGDGPDKDIIQAASRQARHIEVSLPGWLSSDGIDEFLGADDCLVMNSRWEGEPLVVREFGKRGLSCVVRDIVGIRGVTRKNMRFKTQPEFLRILKIVAANPHSLLPLNIEESEVKREQVLNELLGNGRAVNQ